MASNRRRSKKTSSRRTSAPSRNAPKPTRPDSIRGGIRSGDWVIRDLRSGKKVTKVTAEFKPAPGFRKVAFIPDTHVPNHDKAAWELVIEVLRDFNPDTVVILGDFADFEPVSPHPRKPRSEQFMLSDLGPISAALSELSCVRGSDVAPLRKVYVMGNHESRLERYIAKNAPALDGLFSYEKWLEDQGWEVTPYRRTYKLGKLNITHDTGTAGRNAHRDAAAKHMGSAIIGHNHRMAYEVMGKFDGLPYLAATFGWLGDYTSPTYLHEVDARLWPLGFGIGYMLPDGVTHVQPVPIIDGKCVVEGKVYSLK